MPASADPIIQQPTPTINPSALDNLASEADAARADFFKQADDIFSGRGTGQEATAPPRSTPSSDQGTTSTPPAKPASSAASKTDDAGRPVSGKVPGPPSQSEPKAHGAAEGKEKVPATSTTSSSPAPDDDDIPREYRPGSIKAEQWNKMHAARDALKAERDTLRQQLQRFQEQGASEEVGKRLEALQRERDEFLNKLEAVAAERSPRFEAMFKDRQDAALYVAKSAVGPAAASKIEELLKMPDSEFRNAQLNELAEKLSPIQAGKLANAIAEIDKLNNERQALAARGSELWKQWQQEATEQQKLQRAQEAKLYEADFDQELSGWRGFDLFKQKDGDSGHNTAVQQRIDTAKAIFNGGLERADLARASIWAAIGPDLVRTTKGLQERLAALEAENASLRSVQPGVAGDAGGSSGEQPTDPALDYSKAIAAAAMREGILR